MVTISMRLLYGILGFSLGLSFGVVAALAFAQVETSVLLEPVKPLTESVSKILASSTLMTVGQAETLDFQLQSNREITSQLKQINETLNAIYRKL